MDWVKNLFSIEEKKVSLLAVLLIVIAVAVLYYCRNSPDYLVEIYTTFLIQHGILFLNQGKIIAHYEFLLNRCNRTMLDLNLRS